MTRILHVQGSPLGAESVSTRLAAAFLDAWRRARPDGEVDVLDVWAEDLPPLDGTAVRGRLAAESGRPAPPDQAAAFARVRRAAARLRAADGVVLSTGMWNFAAPYRLKHWLDLVLQEGETYRHRPEGGYEGLVTGRPLQLLLASGGDPTRPPLDRLDHLTPWLRAVFGVMGFTDIRVLHAPDTAAPAPRARAALDAALAAAAEAGRAF